MWDLGFVAGFGLPQIVFGTGEARGLCKQRRVVLCSTAVGGEWETNAKKRRKSTAKRLKEISEQIREELKSENKRAVKISLPYQFWKPLGLSPKLKLVRIFVDEDSLEKLPEFRRQVFEQMVRLFPGLSHANPKFVLLSDENSFQLFHAAKQLESDVDLKTAMRTVELLGSPLTLTLVPNENPPDPEREHVPEPKRLKLLKEENADTVTALSFYLFREIDAEEFVLSRSRRVLEALGVLGRMYIAKEGVNAQLCVPSNMLRCLEIALANSPIDAGRDMPDVAEWADRWVPREIRGALLNVDRDVPLSDTPFLDLRIKIRHQVLADGLAAPLDWSKNGKAIDAETWHETLSNEDEDVLVLDCRNKYESQVGKFENATALNTESFRESWDWLREELQETEKNKKILTYCTGGIRCVKVGAFLEQELGFENVERLEGGIVAYSKYVRENEKDSKFKGVNYVFDLRIGERVTEDVLTSCLTCGEPCDVQTDCANERCGRPFHTRHFVQCASCAAKMKGCCSKECHDVLEQTNASRNLESSTASSSGSESGTSLSAANEQLLDAYAVEYSTAEPELFSRLRDETWKRFTGRAHMACGPVVGRLLRTLVQMTKSDRVLELGTFTGYSSMWMASGILDGGKLLTCDIDDETVELARSFFQQSSCGSVIESRLCSANDLLDELVESKEEPFDFVFIDANKAMYTNYYERIISSNLVRVGGTMVIDNVLFKGGVPFLHDDNNSESTLSQQLRNRRTHSIHEAGRLAKKMHEFNKYVRSDPRTEQLLLPVRDGITIVTRAY